jgi:hypothetical protein
LLSCKTDSSINFVAAILIGEIIYNYILLLEPLLFVRLSTIIYFYLSWSIIVILLLLRKILIHVLCAYHHPPKKKITTGKKQICRALILNT